MKKILTAFAALLVGMGCFADVTVADMTVQQRYPWNGKVDIVVTLTGTADEVANADCVFAATNSATHAALSVAHITEDGVLTGSGTTWTHRFVWDAEADVGAVKIADVALTVDVDTSVDVQLWENGPHWAKCNVGASKPEEYGYYFWWGDTVGYSANTNSATWRSGYYYWYGVTWVSSTGTRMRSSPFDSYSCPTYNKSTSELQSQGYIDSTGNLVAKYDAATVHLGTPWRMPTSDEMRALVDNCTTTWTTRNGVYGRLVTGKGAYASKSIFLPAAGDGSGSELDHPGSYGYYWPSTPRSDLSDYAWGLYFYRGNFGRNIYYRYHGRSVRPLRGFAK
ncbi:MAG: DUF1566 domain-containing protein [Kiritimatiellae bacterium]|nr:DUF1566 domain-containing protein [Kiritimatiellia bacterium]